MPKAISMRLLPVSCSALLSVSAVAQLAPDQWVVSTFTDYITSQVPGGLWLIDAAGTTAAQLSSQTANMPAANAVAADEAGMVFYGTLRTGSVPVPNPCEIFSVLVAGGMVITETRLTTAAIDAGSVSAITLRRDQIWFVTDAGNVGWIPKAGGAATIVLNLAAQGVVGLGQSITTNGREIFVGTSFSTGSTDPAQVWSLDAESAAPTLTPLALLGGSAFALDLARDGMVLAGRINGRLYLVDPAVPNQTAVQINAGALAPQSNCNGTAINPWTNVVGNVPGYGSVARQFGLYDVATNVWTGTLPLNTAVPSGVASVHEEPFFLFGKGCPGSNLAEPRMGWSGIPAQGQTFSLTVGNADVNPGYALLILGFSDVLGPVGPLPTDLGFLGAPGCFEYVSFDLSLLALLLNGAGSIPISLPVSPVVTGFRFYGQWATGSPANALGFVLSSAVAIQAR